MLTDTLQVQEERFVYTENLPVPLVARKDGFEKLKPSILDKLSLPALKLLSKTADTVNKKDEVLKLYGGDQAKAVESLSLLLQNADMVDIATRIGLEEEEFTKYIPGIEGWKSFWISHYNNPEFKPPEIIASESDVVDYLEFVSPIRPGMEPSAQGMYALIWANPDCKEGFYKLFRSELVGMTGHATIILENAARLALEISKGQPEMEKQVVSAIGEGIQSQDKWWVLGSDDFPPVVRRLFKLLAEYKPTGGMDNVLDTLYRKAEMDAPAVWNSTHRPSDIDTLFHGDVFSAVVTPVIDLIMEFDPREIQHYLSDKYMRGATSNIITEFIITRPELHKSGISFDKSRKLEYFGRTFIFDGLPVEEPLHLRELTFGIVLVEKENGEPVGLYQPDPSIYDYREREIHLPQIRPESLLYWNTKAKRPIAQERLEKFYSEFTAIREKIVSRISDRLSPAAFPLASYFRLWEYMEDQPSQLRDRLNEFLDKHGLGLMILIAGEGSPDTITRIVKFGLDTYEPNTINSYTQQLFRCYSDLSNAAWNYAEYISKAPEQVESRRNLILQRAKAYLLAAANKYEKQGRLSREDWGYLFTSFNSYSHYLDALADPSGKMAQEYHIPYELVQNSYRYFDPDDAESREVFYSMFDFWFETNAARQELAEYSGKVDDITIDFYQAYEELENDAGQTTAAPELEKARYLKDLDRDMELGRLKRGDSERSSVGFLGAGKLRMENNIIAYLQLQLGKDAVDFVAMDFNPPPVIPEGVTYENSNMANVGELMPNRFDRIYSIWSPIMDVLELKQLKQVMRSIAKAVRPGCVVEIDNHFPFGAHSYEKIKDEYKEANFGEPEGMMEREFTRKDKPPLKKRFFASDPFIMIPLAARYGLRCVNMPSNPDELLAFCKKASQDDSFIPTGAMENLDTNAVYRTTGENGWNRITYKFIMDEPKPDIDKIIAEDEMERV